MGVSISSIKLQILDLLEKLEELERKLIAGLKNTWLPKL